MKKRVSSIGVGVLVVGAILVGLSDARAGQGPGDFATCVATPGPSMCYGTLAGFRNNTDPNAEAGFSMNGDFFSATLNGQSWSCTVSSTLYPQVAALWSQTLSFKGYFFIIWDQQGYCSSLSFFNGSEFQN